MRQLNTLDQIDVEAAKKVQIEMGQKLASNTLSPEDIEEAQKKLKKANAQVALSLH